MSTLRIIRITAWSIIALLSVGIGYVALKPDANIMSGFVSIGGPFQLGAHDGRVVDSNSLKGKPFALFFGFTNCPDVCPSSMLEITNDLNALGDIAKDFPVLFITVDPERDTAALLKEYISSFDARIIGLIPKDEAELAAITKSYRVIYRKVPTPSGYTMDHTASMYLMDGAGLFFGTLDSRETVETRQAKLKRLIGKS